MSVTRAQAEAALAAVKQRYKGYDDTDEIRLLEDWDGYWGGSYGRIPWLICWEDGPYEWAYRATMGGVNEEVAVDLEAEFGASAARAGKLATERAIRFPAGVLAEPYDSFTLVLSEDC